MGEKRKGQRVGENRKQLMCQCACAVSECLCFALTSYSFFFLLFPQRSNPKATRAIPLVMWPLTMSLGPAHPLTSPFLYPRVFLASTSQTPFLHMLRFWSHLFLDFTHLSPPIRATPPFLRPFFFTFLPSLANPITFYIQSFIFSTQFYFN